MGLVRDLACSPCRLRVVVVKMLAASLTNGLPCALFPPPPFPNTR